VAKRECRLDGTSVLWVQFDRAPNDLTTAHPGIGDGAARQVS
jgi:hypothetical protein